MIDKVVAFVGIMLLFFFFFVSGVTLVMTFWQWQTQQAEAEILAQTVAKFGSFNSAAEEIYTDFCNRRGYAPADMQVSVEAISGPGGSPFRYGQPFRVTLTHQYAPRFRFGPIEATLPPFTLKGEGVGISNYVETGAYR